VSSFRSDPTRTSERFAELDDYMTRNVYGRCGFVCASKARCSAAADLANAHYVEGQLSHVGSHYDMFENDVPWRIVVVGLEAGSQDEHVSLDDRRTAVADSKRKSFELRNPHMKGTTSALRLAFGREPGEDRDGELLPIGRNFRHVFDCFALANKRLCSAIDASGVDGRRNRAAKVPDMDATCLPHLEATIRILEPTLIVLQGAGLRGLIHPRLRKARSVMPLLEVAEFGGVETMIANFYHPAYPDNALNWGTYAGGPYLCKTVAPVIAAARTYWLGE
jgi:uracil-DNA glycosylase